MKCPNTMRLKVLALFAVILFGVACPAALASPLNVFVVNYPLKYFAERIGGDEVQVTLQPLKN